MESDTNLKLLSRRALFRNSEEGHSKEKIPGAGKSASDQPERHLRVRVTMNLDGDIATHFKERGKMEGRPYQLLINEALREYIEGSKPERIAGVVSEYLGSDQDFIKKVANVVRNQPRE